MLLVIFASSLATLLAGRSALRGGSLLALTASSFAWGGVVVFVLLVRGVGVDRVFGGASLEALGVLALLVPSVIAGAITSLALTGLARRYSVKRSVTPLVR